MGSRGSGLWDLLKERGHLGERGVGVNAVSPACPTPTCTEAPGRTPRGPHCHIWGLSLAGSALSPPLLAAGVTGILATELFDQMARPAAYMVCGALMWTMLFLVGLGFPFIMVGLPLPPGGAALGFVPVRMRTPVGGLHPRRRSLKGMGLS